jgi:hypothetical protein
MIAVTKSRFASAEQHFLKRQFALVEWLPDRSGVRFDAFVITITPCRSFCDGHHIAPIASVLTFENSRSGGPAIAFLGLSRQPSGPR